MNRHQKEQHCTLWYPTAVFIGIFRWNVAPAAGCVDLHRVFGARPALRNNISDDRITFFLESITDRPKGLIRHGKLCWDRNRLDPWRDRRGYVEATFRTLFPCTSLWAEDFSR